MPEIVRALRWISLFAGIFIISCLQSLVQGASTYSRPTRDLLGGGFFCGASPEKNICLSFIEPSCHLTIHHGKGIPREPEERLILRRNESSFVVHGPNDMAECVTIHNDTQALEYVRLFSSLKTVHLFSEQVLEIYPKEGNCYLVCLPVDRWNDLGLTSPSIEPSASSFLVTRHVIKPTQPESRSVKVFRLVQRVTSDGRIYEVSSTPIEVSKQDLLWLGFPGYL